MVDMMKKVGVYLSTCLLLCIGSAFGILNANPRTDITDDRQFGCVWFTGGILTCTCEPGAKEFYIKENSIKSYDLMQIKIKQCQSVRFGENAIKYMRNLRNIELNDIEKLIFESYSFNWEGYAPNNRDDLHDAPTVKISVHRCTIDKISSYTFKGRIGEIKFSDVIIKQISAFAFTLLQQTEQVEFVNTSFQLVEPQMLKKFNVHYLLISNSYFESLPSRAFSEINVKDSFFIKNTTFKDIRSSAFIVNSKNFEVADCKIETLDGEGFKIKTNGDVFFTNNVIRTVNTGAFYGISNSVPAAHYFTVSGCHFVNAEASGLLVNTTSFQPKFSNIVLNTKCHCEVVEAFLTEFYLQELSCSEGNVPILMKTYKKEFCTTHMGYSITIIIVCVCVLVVIVIATVLTYYFRNVYRRGHYGEKDGKKKGEPKVIMPDGQTYRETEIMYIVERADLLTTDL